MDGTWGLVIMHKDLKDSLICARKGSPMLIGFGDRGVYVSSEPIAFHRYTNNFIRMNDREIIMLSLDKTVKDSVKDRIVCFDKIEIKTKPSEGFDSFFEEEIYEQPEAIKRALGYFHRLILNMGVPKLGGFETHKETALKIENLVLIGCGSSFNACLYGMHIFKIY